jgi:hypothetical protein
MLPVTVLLLFAIGEMAGGDVSGAQHLPEAAALLILLIAGWRYPRVVGIVLLSMGVTVLAIWLVLVVMRAEVERESLVFWVGSGVILFGLPVTAGWFFLNASRIGPKNG